MPDYRRNYLAGGCFFFTVNLLDRRSDLVVAEIDSLRDAVRQARLRSPFTIDAWVGLPDQMHCLWTLPDGDVSAGSGSGSVQSGDVIAASIQSIMMLRSTIRLCMWIVSRIKLPRP